MELTEERERIIDAYIKDHELGLNFMNEFTKNIDLFKFSHLVENTICNIDRKKIYMKSHGHDLLLDIREGNRIEIEDGCYVCGDDDCNYCNIVFKKIIEIDHGNIKETIEQMNETIENIILDYYGRIGLTNKEY